MEAKKPVIGPKELYDMLERIAARQLVIIEKARENKRLAKERVKLLDGYKL